MPSMKACPQQTKVNGNYRSVPGIPDTKQSPVSRIVKRASGCHKFLLAPTDFQCGCNLPPQGYRQKEVTIRLLLAFIESTMGIEPFFVFSSNLGEYYKAVIIAIMLLYSNKYRGKENTI